MSRGDQEGQVAMLGTPTNICSQLLQEPAQQRPSKSWASEASPLTNPFVCFEMPLGCTYSNNEFVDLISELFCLL
jgi:hypothetical protein